MKTITTLLFFIVSLSGFSQSNYEKGMRKAFDLWGENKTEEAANLFERIAQAEPDNWLPPFYVAQINIINSFNEQDKEKMMLQMKKAQDFVNDTKAIAKDNPDVMVLEAQLLTAWVVYDGQQYGMKYSAKITQLYNQAAQLAPENPMVVLGKAEWDMGSAKYFGKDTTPYCDNVKKAIQLFATFKPASEFHPSGSLKHAQNVLKNNCTE